MVKPTQKSVKKIAGLSLLMVLVFSVPNLNMLLYGVTQLKGQAQLLLKRQSISEIMAQSATTIEIKNKLLFVDSVKQFSCNELGFGENKNYSTYVELNGKPVLWTISASEKYSLKSYYWNYPILGEMAYKGYFDSLKLAEESKSLMELNYEVCEGEVQAWSTLGFLPDPILSSMLELPKEKLARLIIHELTHSEIFIASDANLNENVASFIGDKGALLFLKKQYGENSKEATFLKNYLNDLDLLTDFTINFKSRLAIFYETLEGKTNKEKENFKEIFLSQYLVELRKLNFKNRNNFKGLLESENNTKNCFFNDFSMYRDFQNDFSEKLENDFNGDLKLFVKDYQTHYGNSINPFR